MNKRLLILLALSLLILVGLVGVADPRELLLILGRADPAAMTLSIFSYTLAIVVFALIWHLLLQAAEINLSLINNLRLVFSSVFFNVVTPTASYGGEAVRTYLLSKRFNQDLGRGAATIVAHRIIGTFSNSLATFALGIYLIVFLNIPKVLLAIIGIVTFSSFFGFLLILYLGFRIEWSKRLVDKIFSLLSRVKKFEEGARQSAYSTLESYRDGLEVIMGRGRVLILSLFLGIFAWFFVNMVAVFSFKALGGTVTGENFLLIFTFFSVSRLIPTGLPEFVGSKEAILAALYSASGLPVSLSIAVTILIRLATQLWMIILGGGITLQLGLEGFGKEHSSE